MPYNDNNEVTLLARLMVLEKQIENLEKTTIRTSEVTDDLYDRLNNLKYQLQNENVSKETVANIEKNIKSLEGKISEVRFEVSEMAIFKRIGWLILSFILISILGVILNTTLFNKSSDVPLPNEDIVKKLDAISEKLSKEYKK